MQLGFIIILIIAIFVTVFAIQNGTPVPVDLFLVRFQTPLAVVMMICLILGAVIVLLLGTFRQLKKTSQTKELKNKIKVLETEKVQSDNNIKAMQTEILNLKENSNSLSSKVLELEEKNKEQAETIDKLNEEAKLGNKIYKTEIEEGAGSEIDNEKSEAHSE